MVTNQTLNTVTQPRKPNLVAYILMGILAMLFAYIVTKDVVLPRSLLVGGALIGGIVLFSLGISKPEVITYVLVAYMPFSKVLQGDFGGLAMALNFTNVLMAFIIVAWVTGRYLEGEPLWLSTPLNLPILLFMFVALISLIRGSYYESGYWWLALIEFKRWVTPALLYFLVLNTVKERPMIKNIVITMIIVTTLVGLMAIYDYIELGETSSLEKARIGGISEQSNTLAAFFCYYMFLPFGFFLMNMSRWRYWGLLIPFLIQFRGIMVTFSRGGYLAFALGLYAITFFRNKAMILLMIAATVVAIMNPIILPAGIRYRMEQTFTKGTPSTFSSVDELEGELEASATSRVEVWKGAIKMIKEHPGFGVGYGLFDSLIPYYWSGGTPIDAHNTYLIIAAEMGVPALLIFLLMIAMIMWNTWRLYATTSDKFAKAMSLGFLGGLFALLMSNMFGSRLDSQEVASYLYILAALVMRLRILDRKEGTRASFAPMRIDPKEDDPGDKPAGEKPQFKIRKRPSLDSCWNEED